MHGLKITIGGQGAGMFSVLRGALVGAGIAEAEGSLPVFQWARSCYDDQCPNLWPLLFHQHVADPIIREVAVDGHPGIPANDSYYHNRIVAGRLIKHVTPITAIPELPAYCRVAIHYRALDKANECTLHPLNVYLETALKLCQDMDIACIFIASDAQDCIEEARKFFSYHHTQVIVYNHMRLSSRSTRRGLHYTGDKDSRIMQAREAIVDAWTLSKCDYLISNVSNLSYWSTYLNLSQVHVVIR